MPKHRHEKTQTSKLYYDNSFYHADDRFFFFPGFKLSVFSWELSSFMSHWTSSCTMAIPCCLFQLYHWNVLLVWVFNRQVVKQTLVCLHYTEKVGRYISAGFVCIFKAAYFNRSLEKTSELLLDFWRCDAVSVVLHIKFLPLHEYLGFAQSFNYICNNWE